MCAICVDLCAHNVWGGSSAGPARGHAVAAAAQRVHNVPHARANTYTGERHTHTFLLVHARNVSYTTLLRLCAPAKQIRQHTHAHGCVPQARAAVAIHVGKEKERVCDCNVRRMSHIERRDDCNTIGITNYVVTGYTGSSNAKQANGNMLCGSDSISFPPVACVSVLGLCAGDCRARP